MKIKNNRSAKIKISVIIIITLFIALFALSFLGMYQERQFNEEINSIHSNYQEEKNKTDKTLENKDKTIEEKEDTIKKLQEEKEKLDDEIEKLNNEIDKLKIAKEKITVTTRGSSTTREVSATPISSDKWIWAEATAYCPCASCCGKETGITASGTKATAGRTIAASSNYSFGTKIEIEGLGVYTVEDRGGAINGNRIDIFFNTHQEALNFGRRQIKMRVVE